MAASKNVSDVWDSNGVNDVAADLSKLNVEAPAFVPGQNVFASAFIPTESKSKATISDALVEEEVQAEVKADGVDDDMVQESAPDTWEGGTEASAGSADSESPMEEEEEVVEAPRAKPKRLMSEGEPEKKKEHINVVFIGHVDAGKSTIGGHIMFLTGMVDKRTLEKYEKEAKEKNRESWYLSWALDTNLEEREKGKTVEVGRAFFETENKHFTILDAPGHKSFVPNMIGGAAQADVAVLVISARRGEFETGFERGGQTREHAMLVKTAGVKHLIVLINKMDEPTVKWDETRYKECKDKLTPFLKKMGFNTKQDVFFMPCSGYTGAFLKEAPSEAVCPWFRGPCLIEYLEKLPPLNRNADAPVRMPVVDKYKDMGTIVLGKLESGTVTKGMELTLMPNRVNAEVLQIWSDDNDTDEAVSGENVKLKLKNIEDDDVSSGFILCSPASLCHVGQTFDAHVLILEHRSIICPGYTAVMHLHTCSEEVTFLGFHYLLDRKTGDKVQKRPRFVKQDQAVIARLRANGGRTCMEAFAEFPQLGRFTLRDEGKSVAIGKILKVVD